MGAWRAGRGGERGGERGALHAQRPPLPVGSVVWEDALFRCLEDLIPGSCWGTNQSRGGSASGGASGCDSGGAGSATDMAAGVAAKVRKEEEDGLNQMLRRVLSQRPSPGAGKRDDTGTALAGGYVEDSTEGTTPRTAGDGGGQGGGCGRLPLLPRSVWSGIDPAQWELLSSLCEAVRVIRNDVDTNYTSTEFLYSFRRCRLTIDPKAQYALYPVASNKETALLGGGAFGKVYSALQVEHRLKRAIKFIDVAMAGGGAGGNVAMAEERLREEAKAAIDAVHTNVLRVYEDFSCTQIIAGHRHRFYCLVMEVCDCSLHDFLLQQRGRLRQNDLQDIAAQIACGLGYLHEQGLVHRDVKLHNCLVKSVGVGPPWRVVISDFGHTKAIHRTRRDYQVGDVAYRAPEMMVLGASPSRRRGTVGDGSPAGGGGGGDHLSASPTTGTTSSMMGASSPSLSSPSLPPGPTPPGYDERVDLFALGITYVEISTGLRVCDGGWPELLLGGMHYCVAAFPDVWPSMVALATERCPVLGEVAGRLLQAAPEDRLTAAEAADALQVQEAAEVAAAVGRWKGTTLSQRHLASMDMSDRRDIRIAIDDAAVALAADVQDESRYAVREEHRNADRGEQK